MNLRSDPFGGRVHRPQTLPSPSTPELQAQHAEILRLCTASFLKDTAQGRLHNSLDRIRMRRVEADEERAAKALRDSQRAASLKRWIMRECARQRERKAQDPALLLGLAIDDDDDKVSCSGSSSDCSADSQGKWRRVGGHSS